MTKSPMTEQELREQICHIGRLMHQQGYIDGTAGNITARLGENRFLATPSGLAKGFMTPDQILIVDPEGNVLEGAGDLKPTSESLMHLECYRQRPDVVGVVHAHPPTAVALTIIGYDFYQCLIPEMIVILGLVPTTPYATPSGPENRDAITKLILEHDAIMLAHHGSLTVADNLWDAYLKLESLEHSAKILYRVEQLGGPKEVIPLEQVKKLLATRESLGLMRPGDEERFYGLYKESRVMGFGQRN